MRPTWTKPFFANKPFGRWGRLVNKKISPSWPRPEEQNVTLLVAIFWQSRRERSFLVHTRLASIAKLMKVDRLSKQNVVRHNAIDLGLPRILQKLWQIRK